MTTEAAFLRALGARILSEANDLKRTPAALSQDLKLPATLVDDVIAGKADTEAARKLLMAMAEAYPISLADIWLDTDDTDGGVRIMTAEESRLSSRVFNRKDRTGALSPYYDYRDTAMSRGAPFKPEWILELRTVSDDDPNNPDVTFNHGHFLHQATFFIGEVNFYWDISGTRYCRKMETGDSNYITPFVPHSFTSRNPKRPGLIIAVTYGGDVRRAFREFADVDGDGLISHAGSLRGDVPFALRLQRQLDAESLSRSDFGRRLTDRGMDARNARAIFEGRVPAADELEVIAGVLNIRPQDLMAVPVMPEEEVVIATRGNAVERGYPDGNRPAYRLAELARSRHQPLLKGFDVTVLGGDQGDMRHGLHEYVFNYGDEPVDLIWGDGKLATLNPGDSAYLRPLVRHRFDRYAGAAEGRLAMLRVPGALTDAALDEFAGFAEAGRHRAIKETTRWF